jgi:TPP-dependent pyruvate/acetoin dehydrogenase alpha subunit
MDQEKIDRGEMHPLCCGRYQQCVILTPFSYKSDEVNHGGPPRNKIDIPYHVDYLSILDETGTVDKELEPDISEDFLLDIYKAMVLGRRFDERMLNLQRQGRIGTFPPITGQEAAQLGTVVHLRQSDWFVPSFREMAAEIWRGRALETFLLYYAGYNEGVDIAGDQNNLPLSVPVGSQTLHAVGLAWAVRYRKKDDVAMTWFGDGATSEGDFHEAMNFAGVFRLPVIFVCQNNQWAISSLFPNRPGPKPWRKKHWHMVFREFRWMATMCWRSMPPPKRLLKGQGPAMAPP